MLVPILETERLILRGHRIEDFENSEEMWADFRVVEHISGTPSTREQSWSRLLRYSGHWQLLGFGYWAVTTRSDGAFIGEVGFAYYQRDTTPSIEGIPEAGWVLRSEAHGNGYATEAVSRSLLWADDKLSADKTVCLIDPSYTASINVAKKCGYGNEQIGNYKSQKTLFLERNRKVL